ncbi:hypothetical protein ACU18_15355 [Arthrobacter sp. ZBG10]|uniref:DUF4913 domain-containing protein n=1 Tax=Arthrobacter sp. ZBG10 TaxID=1676590 RepID=UPI0006833FC8|nr:DUF4913 domain-containing protein [Arthrobacter sp. ZBG10]KNH15980.1 hypothetical protein ACU18_15355 [Arthrobacter sp. ZBG10]
MTDAIAQDGQFPEDHLPGIGLLFDGTDPGQDAAAEPPATSASGTPAPVPAPEPAVIVEESEEAPEPAFRTVYDFYEGVYGPLYEHYDSSPGVLAQRGTTAIRWCRQWWNHESVMMRLTALWQAYEVAYAEGGGAMSTWMLDHADRHFDRIMTEGGPLSECRSNHDHQMTRYPTDPLPEGNNLDATTVP